MWIEGAYSHFADVGPEQLNIKRISEIAGLPRTNFYYHFPDTDILVTQLLNFHVDLSKEYEKELWKTLTDSWYARLDFEDFSPESLAELSDSIMQSILEFNRETAILRQKRS